MSKKVALFMGHSGSEKGSNGFLNEDTVNREAVNIAIAWFKSKGFTVLTDNDQMSLTQRIVKANTYQVDGLIEFHSNMGGGTGTEVWRSKFSDDNHTKAKTISDSVKQYLPSRGAKNSKNNRYGALGIVDDTLTKNAYLVELFFLDNQSDCDVWKKHKKAIVETICQAFCKVSGWNVKAENKPQPSKPKTEKPTNPIPRPEKGKPREWNEKGTFTVREKNGNNIALRYGRNRASELVAWIKTGESIKYDKVHADVNGYLWVRQTPRRLKNGKYVEAWIATGRTNDKAERRDYWGTFK